MHGTEVMREAFMLSRTSQRYQHIVDQVEGVARAQSGEQLHIEFLCRTCRVTERTLRNAFHSVCGATPYRYLRTHRMQEARDALLHADAATTVTSIATQFGFLELGRFSVEYRSTFGERPSETLKRSALINHARYRRAAREGAHVAA
jgi:transcriptional regulator GlxA family with amidase domain